MKFLVRSFVFAVLVQGSFSAQAGAIDPKLQAFLRSDGNSKTKVIALFGKAPEQGPAPRRYNAGEVRAYLERKAKRSYEHLKNELEASPSAKKNIRVEWISKLAGAVIAEVTPEGLRLLGQMGSISKIYANYKVKNYPTRASRHGRSDAEIPYDLRDIGLDQVRQKYPKLDGSGVFLGSVDSGVDVSHPALSGKIAAFYDGMTQKPGIPKDYQGHGTHTIGTMVGSVGENRFGVAPGAKMISAGSVMDTANTIAMLKSMEFMLNPEGPGAVKIPCAVNNSWGHPEMPDHELFYRAIEAWEAAGILAVFAAGNDGTPQSIGIPGNHPLALTIGATGPNGKLTDFSSRGPAVMNGKTVQKPDLTAPGAEILSSIVGGGYEAWEGTSMSAPHVAGAVALLVQAKSDLNPAQLRALLLKSVEGRDANGNLLKSPAWNASYGYGKLSMMKALELLRVVVQGHRPQAGGELASFFQGRETIDAASVESLAEEELWTSTWEDSVR